MNTLIIFRRFNCTFKLNKGLDYYCLSINNHVDTKCRTLYITHNLAMFLLEKYSYINLMENVRQQFNNYPHLAKIPTTPEGWQELQKIK